MTFAELAVGDLFRFPWGPERYWKRGPRRYMKWGGEIVPINTDALVISLGPHIQEMASRLGISMDTIFRRYMHWE